MTSLEVFFVVLAYLSLAPIILVLVVIARQQRVHTRDLKALERVLQRPATSVKTAPAPVTVPVTREAADAVPPPPWLRPNYIAPEDYVQAGFDYTIRVREAAIPRPVPDQGGFAVIKNRYHRRQGGAFMVQRTIYLN